MKLPCEVPVMTLPNAILFPQALIPLYIFEPRYRKMLADSLSSHRMFSIAMRRPDTTRETHCAIGGLGLIRASVLNKDGTSHLIIQGLTRVHFDATVQRRPYRIERIRALAPETNDSVTLDALLEKVRELVAERLDQGLEMNLPVLKNLSKKGDTKGEHPIGVFSLKNFADYLDKLDDPDQVADLVACTFLPGPTQRQLILETVEVELRLKHLVHFLMAEVDAHRKNRRDE